MQVLVAIFFRYVYDDSDMVFPDRLTAGKQLATVLAKKLRGENVVVYALPRGGVVTAIPIAKRLLAPLDLVITRKISPPNQPEYAVGAVGLHGPIVGNEKAMRAISPDILLQKIKEERAEIKRREFLYRLSKPEISVRGKIAVLVDDGIATGLTMLAATYDVETKQPKRIIVVSPVIAYETYQKLREQVDDVVALVTPNNLQAIGQYYQQFPQVSDVEVIGLLQEYKKQYKSENL